MSVCALVAKKVVEGLINISGVKTNAGYKKKKGYYEGIDRLYSGFWRNKSI
jgi:hypothetical protein